MSKQPAIDLRHLELNAYLEQLASSAATPGGGAAAAFTGAQAAALLAMVCNLSSSEQFRDQRQTIDSTRGLCDTSRAEFIELAALDAEAFSEVMNAYGMPRGSDKEKTTRSAAIQQRLVQAARIPFEVMRTAAALLPAALDLADSGNKNLITDTGIAVHLIEACMQAARLNIRINLKLIRDKNFVGTMNTDMQRELEVLTRYRDNILHRVEQRL